MRKTVEERSVRQYILVNEELGMSVGKIAAQVAHAAAHSTRKLERAASGKNAPSFVRDYLEWMQTGETTIVLAANKAQMQAFSGRDGAFAVRDAGLTEVPRGSLTVIALAPSPPLAELGKLYTL